MWSRSCWLFILTLIAGTVLQGMTVPTLEAGRTTRPPSIDGRPDDPCWQNTAVATDFSVLASGGAERAFRQTTARVVWDHDALYLLVVCLEPRPEILSAKAAERDGPTWLDDAVEIFLQPEPTAGPVFHFIVNSGGVLFDQKADDPGFDLKTEPAVRVYEQSWVVEMAVPWQDLAANPPASGALWGFNLGREHRPHEPTEWSTWAPLKEGVKKFSVPSQFGKLQFVDDAKALRSSSLDLPKGLLKNPWFAEGKQDTADHWHVRDNSTRFEIAPMSSQYAVGGTSDYTITSQQLGNSVNAGDIYTVFAILRGSADATAGIAVVQHMQDGRPDDLYPFWNISLAPYWQLYSGRIVVDQGAERFKAAAIYRSNRKGRVDCAYMQIVPGIHGVDGIVDITACTKPGERATGEIWKTPSLKPFNPLPGGPLKAAIFISKYQRDAAELMQRLDLEADLIYCPSFRGSGTVETVVAYDAGRVLRDLAAKRYDLIILAGRPSEQAVVDAILETVRDGAGLVAIEPVSAEEPAKPDVYAQLAKHLPKEQAKPQALKDVFGGLNLDVLEAQSSTDGVLSSVALGAFDEGRIARLVWAEKVPGLIPFCEGVGTYWEYRWAALAKAALWAADRQTEPLFSRVALSRDSLEITIQADYAPGMEVQLTWDTPDGEIRGQSIPIPPYSHDRTRLELPVPDFLAHQRGPLVARLLLHADNHPCDIAAALHPGTKPRIRLEDLQATDIAEPGATISGQVRCSVVGKADPVITAELVDAFDRVLERVQLEPPALGSVTIPFELQLRDPLSVYHWLVVTAKDGPKTVAAKLRRPVFAPSVSADHLSDFQLAAGYAVMHITCQPYLIDHFTDFLRHHGVTACTVNESLIQNGMPAWGGTVCGTGMAHRSDEPVRKHCFSNPQNVQKLTAGTVENVAKRRRWGFFGYNMHDEVHLSQKANVETCASEDCIQGFRTWAEKEYGSLDQANSEWGTHYASFDEVGMPRIADMEPNRNPAQWVDYRLFMEQMWADAYAAAAAAVLERFPNTRMSFTNPYKFNSLSGTDFSLWTPNEQVLLRYFHRHVMDRNRSWSPAPMLAWIGYRDGALQLERFMWWFALNGGTTPIWWDPILPWAYSGKPGYTPWNMFDPLWRETDRGQRVTAAALELEAGIGKLLRMARPAPPEVVILHSQPSMHVLYAEAALKEGRITENGYNDYRHSDDALAEAMGRAGLAYTYMVSGQLSEQSLATVDLIAMPSCVALHPADVPILKTFVQRGGRLLADRTPGTHSVHGRPLAHPSLPPELFDGTRGICLGKGAGKRDADLLDEALTTLGIQPAWRLTGAEGGAAGPVQMIRLRLTDVDIVGIVQDSGDAVVENLQLSMPDKKQVFDLRQRKRLGRRRNITFALPPGNTALFAVTDHAPRGMSLKAGLIDRKMTLAIAVNRDPALMHAFHVELTPPGASKAPIWYRRNIPAAGGKAVVSVPLALNDAPGRWTASVGDVLTGMESTATVSVPEEQMD